MEQKKQFQQENVNRVAGELQNICQQMEEASGNNMQAADLILERFVSQSPKELLIAPDWGLKNYEFTARVQKRMKERGAYQGKAYLV